MSFRPKGEIFQVDARASLPLEDFSSFLVEMTFLVITDFVNQKRLGRAAGPFFVTIRQIRFGWQAGRPYQPVWSTFAVFAAPIFPASLFQLFQKHKIIQFL